ncbi:MAG TPA: ADOP family duplicated permease [Acidobacteriaceae bacterium]|nr:ADOP family duplicated permease [Acidobacteriaceae bacterium]
MLLDRQDLLYALRSTRRTPLLTVVVVFALAVGIGLNAGVFSILNAIVLQPPTRKDPATFAQIYPQYQGWFAGAGEFSTFSAADFDAIRAQSRSLSEVAAWSNIPTMFDDVHQQNRALLVTADYFRVNGIDPPLMGRYFLPSEFAPDSTAHVAVLSQYIWKNRYASDPHILGRVIHLSRQPFTVIGVMPDSAASLTRGGILLPWSMEPLFNHGNSAFRDPGWLWLTVAGRLRPGYSRADARAEMQAILAQRDRFYHDQKIFTPDRKTTIVVTDGAFIHKPAAGFPAATLLFLIMGPLTLVLLLACSNVTMLFLSRSIARRGEMAVRLALGAGRARLLRMLALESLLTAAVAGVASIFLAGVVPRFLLACIDPVEGAAAGSVIRPDWTVFGYLAALVLLAAAASALAPMRESFRLDLVTALKGREGSATMRSRTTGALIVVQIAMSFVLLVAAVLFGRLPSSITRFDSGFETRHLMTVPLAIGSPQYTDASALAFERSLETGLRALPGVQSVSWASLAPFYPPPLNEVRTDDRTKGQGRPAAIDIVSPNFFSTFGIPLLHGRFFQPSDQPAAGGRGSVAVVSASFARAFWGGNDPLGKVVITPDNRRLVIIGIARDTRSETFGVVDGPRLYTLQDPGSLTGGLYVRFAGDPKTATRSVDQTVRGIDPTQTEPPSTIWDFLETAGAEIMSLARIIIFMAGIAVLLAVTGVHGVLFFAIRRRTREFGIQMVLGATRPLIFRAVLARGLRQIALGLVCGAVLCIPAAWAFLRITEHSWLRVNTFDASVYCISAAILLLVSLSAMFLPAFRATQVDPMEALRSE